MTRAYRITYVAKSGRAVVTRRPYPRRVAEAVAASYLATCDWLAVAYLRPIRPRRRASA